MACAEVSGLSSTCTSVMLYETIRLHPAASAHANIMDRLPYAPQMARRIFPARILVLLFALNTCASWTSVTADNFAEGRSSDAMPSVSSITTSAGLTYTCLVWQYAIMHG